MLYPTIRNALICFPLRLGIRPFAFPSSSNKRHAVYIFSVGDILRLVCVPRAKSSYIFTYLLTITQLRRTYIGSSRYGFGG